ncbi:hypothetical protein TWF730_006548 [Orbilia blumenaviensis]|uniref:RING-CH-type domain-containing protein n=1 Tax=Orbilia blumenaviensis TaxID=1796055 RepID=A0AAV9VEK0_9PEZI
MSASASASTSASGPPADPDAALNQYIWVSSNTPGGWDAEPELPPAYTVTDPPPSAAGAGTSSPTPTLTSQPTQEQQQQQQQPRRRRRQVLKQCRICLDQTTDDVDPELGRLISPCKCKGSARYVHEECLRAWRLHSANSQSFYKCPTCHFEYQFIRLRLAQAIASTALVASITAVILLITVYLLGFVADPIINLYINPWYAVEGGSFSFTINGFTLYGPAVHHTPRSPPIPSAAAEIGIVEHMARGLSALGLIGFGKVLVFSHHWIRHIFGAAADRRGGRERMGQLSWIIIIWGVVNFLILIWGYVRNWTKSILDKIAVGVADIGSDEDEEEEEEEREEGGNAGGEPPRDEPKDDIKKEQDFKGGDAKGVDVKEEVLDEEDTKEQVAGEGPVKRKGFATEQPDL